MGGGGLFREKVANMYVLVIYIYISLATFYDCSATKPFVLGRTSQVLTHSASGQRRKINN